MKLVRGWSTAELIQREEVFDGLIVKAVRMTLRPIALQLNQIIVAAPEPALVAAGGPQLSSSGDVNPQPIITTTAGGTITALWDGYVNNELAPYLAQTFLDSAGVVLDGMESALDGSIPPITESYAQQYLASATNRLKGISDMVWQAVQTELQAGLDDGEDMTQLATRVRKAANVLPGRATVIARTEVHNAAEAGSLAQVQLGGFSDAECSKRWLATDDVRTREQHWKANGQVVGLSQPFIVWGEGLQRPGDPTGRPENTIQCRCTMEYLFTDNADLDADDDDLDFDLVTAAPKHDLGDEWDELEHPRGADGKFIKKGTVEYFEAVDAAKKAKAAAAAADYDPAFVKMMEKAKKTGPPVKPSSMPVIDHFDYDEVSAMYNPDFMVWFNGYFNAGNGANENNVKIWKSLNDEEKQLLTDKAQDAYTNSGLSGPYLTVSDFWEMTSSSPGPPPVEPDFVNALIDQEGLAKASQPKKKLKKLFVAKPFKINTNIIYKFAYGDGEVIAEKPGKITGADLRLIWKDGKKPFVLQTRMSDGSWTDVESYGKGAAYKEFKDQTGWTTPVMAMQEAADKMAAKQDADLAVQVQIGKVIDSDDVSTSISSQLANAGLLTPSNMSTAQFNQWFKGNFSDLGSTDGKAKWDALSNTEKFKIIDEATFAAIEGVKHPITVLEHLYGVDPSKFAAPGVKTTPTLDPYIESFITDQLPNISVPSFNKWFHDMFIDEDDQGLKTWNNLSPDAKVMVKDKAQLADALGNPTALNIVLNVFQAQPANPVDDAKIPYPDFEEMHIVALNSWFANLTLEQYDNFEEWEQEGIWQEAKEADDEHNNPKPLEALQSLTGQFFMGGPKSTLPDFDDMSTTDKLNWFDDLTQEDWNQFSSEEVSTIVQEAAELNVINYKTPFKKVSSFVDSEETTPVDLDTNLDDDVGFTAVKPFVPIEKMTKEEFIAFATPLTIDTPSDIFWNTAHKLGLTAWAEVKTGGQQSPHHFDTSPPVIIKGQPIPANVPDKLDLHGLSQPDAMQAVHAFAVAKVTPAHDIGIPIANATGYGVLNGGSAKILQQQMLKEAGTAWTGKQLNAVQQYTTSVGYQTTNAILRNDQKRMKMFSNSQLADGAQRAIDLQSAMTPLTSSVTLHRGTGAQAFGFSTTKVSTDSLKKLQGKTIKDRGFVSTSVVPPTGVGFDYATKPIKVIVRAPKGTPALYVSSATPSWSKENEMILAAGSNFRIDEVREADAKDKATYGSGIEQVVIMTVVPDEGTPTDQLKVGSKVKTPAGTTVTPAPAPVAPPTSPIKIKPSGAILPIKLNTNAIHKMSYGVNQIVAIRYAPLKPGDPPVPQRLVWNGKKFVLHVPNTNGSGWMPQGALTKKDAYAKYKNDTDWFTPINGVSISNVGSGFQTLEEVAAQFGLPTPSPISTIPNAPVMVTAPQTVEDIIGTYGVITDAIDVDNPEIAEFWKSFKTTSGYGTMTLAKPTTDIFKAVAHSVAKWNKANPHNKILNHLQAIKMIDAIAAKKFGATNQKLYETKIVDWLQTSGGMQQAPDIIKLASATAAKAAPATPAGTVPSSIAEALAKIPIAYDIGTPAEGVTDFPDMAPAQASAMNTAMRKKYPISASNIEAIKSYTGSGSTAINNLLRYPAKNYHGTDTANRARLIQEAMYPIPKSITVHRGSDNLGNNLNASTSLETLQKLIGHTVSDGSFFSASVGSTAAFAYKTFRLNIEVPEGTPVVYAKPISSHKSENEIILAAGLHYEVISVKESKSGSPKFTVNLRVVSPK